MYNLRLLVLLLICYGSVLYAQNNINNEEVLYDTGNERLDRIMNSKSPLMQEREDNAYDAVMEMYESQDNNTNTTVVEKVFKEGDPVFGPQNPEISR